MSISSLLNPSSPSETQNEVLEPVLIQPKPTPPNLPLSPTSSTFTPLEINDIGADMDFWSDAMDVVDPGATELMGRDAASTEVEIEPPRNEAPIVNAFSFLKREKLVKIDSVVLGKGKKRGIDKVDGVETTVGKVSRSVGGLSRSAIWERLQNKTIKPPAEKGEQRFEDFKLKILGLDNYAEIQDAKNVRHLKCGKTLVMKYNYSTNNFKTHVAHCTGPPKSAKLPGGGMQSLSIAFQKQTRSVALPSSGSKTRAHTLPCPGLEGASNPKVLGYLNRTGAQGGGAPSVSVLSQQLYGKRFVKLSTRRKAQVKLAQKHEWLWRNDQDAERVHSIDCQKVARTVKSETAPCSNCQVLLQKRRFQNALNVSQPLDQNYKYVNHEYRNKKLAILFGRSADLRPLIEGDVRFSFMLTYLNSRLTSEYN